MPYKSEKIVISNTKYDRRMKLTDSDKERIVQLRNEEGLSQRKLAALFGVSRRLIQFIIDPVKAAKNKERLKEAKVKGLYKYSKEEWASVQREHRRYKHKLYKEGRIHEGQSDNG